MQKSTITLKAHEEYVFEAWQRAHVDTPETSSALYPSEVYLKKKLRMQVQNG